MYVCKLPTLVIILHWFAVTDFYCIFTGLVSFPSLFLPFHWLTRVYVHVFYWCDLFGGLFPDCFCDFLVCFLVNLSIKSFFHMLLLSEYEALMETVCNKGAMRLCGFPCACLRGFVRTAASRILLVIKAWRNWQTLLAKHNCFLICHLS